MMGHKMREFPVPVLVQYMGDAPVARAPEFDVTTIGMPLIQSIKQALIVAHIKQPGQPGQQDQQER